MKRKPNKAEMPPANSLRDYVPTLAKVELDRLLWPEQKALIYTEGKRRTMLATHAEHWTVKLTLKLDRLIFPELLAGESKLSDGKKLGRLVEYLRVTTTAEQFAALFNNSLFGVKLSQRMLDSAMRGDADFFRDTADGLNAATPTLKVYSFMLRNAAAVERCRTCAEIQRLPGFPKYSPQTFCRLCREIGLPLRKRAKR